MPHDPSLDALQSAFETRVPNVSREIHPDERMNAANHNHYFGVGDSAMRLVKTALLLSDKRPADLKRILDFPCGHGRVLRTFRAAFPDTQLTAGDLLADGVKFCADQFNATSVYSNKNPTTSLFPDAGQYDLIFVGSLLTHLDAPRWTHFLQLFHDLLAPNGILIITVHGPFVAYRLETGFSYRYTDKNVPSNAPALPSNFLPDLPLFNRHLLHSYYTTDFAYGDDGSGQGYGISLARPAWTLRQFENHPALRLLYYTERGWDNHQDAVALIKKPFTSPTVGYEHPFAPEPPKKLVPQRLTRSPL